jgi:hypothetical protein
MVCGYWPVMLRWFRSTSNRRQIRGGTCRDIGISNPVGLDLLRAWTAAFLISSRSSRLAAPHPYPSAMETMSRPGMSRPGTPGVS